MTDREKIALEFYIDDHAALFGFWAQTAEEICGDYGLEIVASAVKFYGRERGLRSAMRCLKDGNDLTFSNYLLYGEWLDTKGWSKGEVIALKPRYQTKTHVCGWCESWKKYNLIQYGKIYCAWIDHSLVHGFNPELKLKMDKFLTFGDPACEFDWEAAFSDESQLQEIWKHRKEIAPRVTKDFLYHSAHLLSTFDRTFCTELGLLKGVQIKENALLKYKQKFGEQKCSMVIAESKHNFLEI